MSRFFGRRASGGPEPLTPKASVAGLFEPSTSRASVAGLFNRRRLSGSKEADAGLPKTPEGEAAPKTPLATPQQKASKASKASPGRYTPIGVQSSAARRASSHMHAAASGAMPRTSADEDAHEADVSIVLASLAPASALAAAPASAPASAPAEEPPPPSGDTGAPEQVAAVEVIPVAHSQLLDELRLAMAQLYTEAARSHGLPLGEGSFAVQSLCGVVEQLLAHALQTNRERRPCPGQMRGKAGRVGGWVGE